MEADFLYPIRVFSIPKRGLSEVENEDAVAFDFNSTMGWLAIADGATEASYSREWARLLVESFRKHFLHQVGRVEECSASIEKIRRVLIDTQKLWHEEVPWDRLASRGWLFEEKARQGAFATFLGVKLQGEQWAAIGIGDCNLFILTRTDEMRLSFPASSATAFGTAPLLVPSIPGSAMEKALSTLSCTSGCWQEGEHLIACTDAVAAYLLTHSDEKSVWTSLLAAATPEEFRAWVEAAREVGMRNDDSTAAIVRLTELTENIKESSLGEGISDGLA